MTLNNVLNRIRSICLAHKQVRSFYRGFSTDLLTDRTTNYPAVFLENTGGSIATKGGATSLNFRLSFWDLVNVAKETKLNEQDVDSDMVSVAMDIIAQINYPGWDDWALSVDNALQLVISEGDVDQYGGCTVDFTIRIIFKQNVCAAPSDFMYGIDGSTAVTGNADKSVFDLVYIGLGSEGNALTIPALAGKKVLLITYESSPIYKVPNNPAESEYTFNGTTISLGIPITTGARILILYKNN